MRIYHARQSRVCERLHNVLTLSFTNEVKAGHWRSQKFPTGGASVCIAFLSVHSRLAALPSRPYNQKNVIAHIVCRIRLESIEARLSLIDKNIGTSARFYA